MQVRTKTGRLGIGILSNVPEWTDDCLIEVTTWAGLTVYYYI